MSTDTIEVEAVWCTQKGERIRFSDMETTHLFYSLRMIFNHVAPAHLQIPGCKRYWYNIPASRGRVLVCCLIAELARRKPLPHWMLAQLEHIATASEKTLCLTQ